MNRYDFIVVLGTSDPHEPHLLARTVWAADVDAAHAALASVFRDCNVIAMIEGEAE